MSNITLDMLAAVLGLPEADRAQLASELLSSLPPPSAAIDEEVFGAELQRRLDVHEQDPSIADDWENVSRRLREALENHRQS